jgi:glycosyltransferase involved in cell wall biosynthesis
MTFGTDETWNRPSEATEVTMSNVPIFTVVVATFDRGRHIVPTIESALGQSLKDFELLIVCDGAADDGLLDLAQGDPRVQVIGLPRHTGSQTGPNNAGLAAASGRYIAYLGHDDIWMPDHLSALAELFAASLCDVAVSGCAYHGPPGTTLLQVTGIFDDSCAPRLHFFPTTSFEFPPTSFAHKAALAAAIGGWRQAETISPPVDVDFLLRAVDTGARFASTGRVTAHKFAAGHRYLSYMEPSSVEQTNMLSAIRAGTFNRDDCARLIERAKACGTFMSVVNFDFSQFPAGELYRRNRSNKGIDRPVSIPLTEEVYVPQSMEPRGLDWNMPDPPRPDMPPFRWSGPSLRPKVLIPFIGDVEARITLHLYDHDPVGIIDGIQLTLNGHPVKHDLVRGLPNQVDLKLIGRLRPDKASVMELILPGDFSPAEIGDSSDTRRLGVILTGWTISPASVGVP